MGHRVEVEGWPAFEMGPDETLLEGCEEAGVPMDSACGGFAACNACRVQVLVGAESCNPLLDEEIPFLDGPDQRLGCQLRVSGPVVLRLAPGM
ncbi:MAG: (2Fe-2S)-binding protein [Alphaproteobacteria bacterium]|nr:(2Fe-2S)-binding protein [Alphaproteobacteria bacterium]